MKNLQVEGALPKKPMHNEQPSSALEDQIADNLRRAFQERASEKVPDRFLDLLRQLRSQDETHHER
ncbi:NepR family anti-sigma factor [Pararhodobacter sp.]|uniref:NepR family anti-sigma factor n=1 Tax=Pararhodobacter sp. TaxID=2127056 RepID=UPI002FDFA8C7|nr:RNA polymerase subunit sigma-70 [Pseudomonadota bacterium]